MKVWNTCFDIMKELKAGAIFREYYYSHTDDFEVVTDCTESLVLIPLNSGEKEMKQYSWTGKNVQTGDIVEFLKTEGTPYGPNIAVLVDTEEME